MTLSNSHSHARRRRAFAVLVAAGALAAGQLAAVAADRPPPGAGVDTGPVASHSARAQAAPTLTVVGGVELSETTTGVRDLAVSNSGQRAVAVGGDWLHVLRLTGGSPVKTGRSTAVFGRRVVLSRDGRVAYVLEDTDTLFVVDLTKPRPKKVATLRKRRLAPSDVFDIEISPNGKFLVAKYGYKIGGFGDGSGLQVLSLAKPRQPRRLTGLRAPEWHGRVDFNPKGNLVITSSTTVDEYLLIYRMGRKGQLKRLKRIPLSFSPDAIAVNGRGSRAYVQSSSSEDPLRIAEVNLVKRSLVRVKQVAAFEGGTDLVVSPSGKYLYSSMWRSGPADNPSFITLDAKTLTPRHYAAGEELYGPRAVQSPRRGPAAHRIVVPTYTGFMGGRPLVLVFSYQ